MTRYQAPQNPFDNFPVGCLKVYYPDSPLLFRALRGQLTELENRFLWDTGGNIEAAEKLEQDWLEAGLLTFAAIGQGCADTEDCQQIIIDLTLQIEQLQEQLQEFENMNITVNCNCNTTINMPELTNPDGTVIETVCLPVDPNNPTADTQLPVIDEQTETPPDGWPDWPTFADNRCLLSNYAADMIIDSIAKLDDAENKLSAGSVIMDVASILLLLVPLPVGKIGGLARIAVWVSKLAAALHIGADFLEPINDWLQAFEEEIRSRREQIVCFNYLYYYNPEQLTLKLLELLEEIIETITISELPQNIVDMLKDLVKTVCKDLVPLVTAWSVSIYIPEGYQAPTDCYLCGEQGPEGFAFVPAQLTAVLAVGGSGTSNLVGTVVDDQNSLLQFDAVNAGRTGRLDHTFAARPALQPGEEWIGFVFQPHAVTNAFLNAFALALPNDSANAFITTNLPIGLEDNEVAAHVLPNKGFPAVWEDWHVGETASLNFDANRVKCGLTGQSENTGAVELGFGFFYWIKKLAV